MEGGQCPNGWSRSGLHCPNNRWSRRLDPSLPLSITHSLTRSQPVPNSLDVPKFLSCSDSQSATMFANVGVSYFMYVYLDDTQASTG